VFTRTAQIFRPEENLHLTIPADACRVIPEGP
jgi:hypothetical protein